MTIHLQKRKRDNERDALVPVDEWLILGDSPQQRRGLLGKVGGSAGAPRVSVVSELSRAG